jgi:hypothetical protein
MSNPIASGNTYPPERNTQPTNIEQPTRSRSASLPAARNTTDAPAKCLFVIDSDRDRPALPDTPDHSRIWKRKVHSTERSGPGTRARHLQLVGESSGQESALPIPTKERPARAPPHLPYSLGRGWSGCIYNHEAGVTLTVAILRSRKLLKGL